LNEPGNFDHDTLMSAPPTSLRSGKDGAFRRNRHVCPSLGSLRTLFPKPRMAAANMGAMFPNAEQSNRDILAQTAAPPMVRTTSES
jgi:hypothetical protein